MNCFLKEKRISKKLTQKELATLCGVKRTTITEIENGNSRPSIDTAKAIAKVLGFNWTKFFDDKRK